MMNSRAYSAAPREPSRPVDVVLDDIALLALGSDNVLASRLLYLAADTGAGRVHVALAALTEADRVRTGLA